MPGIALPKAISVAQFQPDPHAQSFSEIFDQAMGNLGSPSDGFDAIFNATVSLQPPGGASDTILGPAQASIAAVRTAISNGPLRTFLSTFSGALQAGTAKYNTFVLTVGPDGQPIGTVDAPAPAPTPTPTPTPTTDCVAPPNDPAHVLRDMTVGDAAYVEIVDFYQSGDPIVHVSLYCGDPAIFGVTFATHLVGQSATTGPISERDFYFVVTPTKAGTFVGAYKSYDTGSGATFIGYYQVTIHSKGTAPQPIGIGPVRRVV
jgi:hypothetical protein